MHLVRGTSIATSSWCKLTCYVNLARHSARVRESKLGGLVQDPIRALELDGIKPACKAWLLTVRKMNVEDEFRSVTERFEGIHNLLCLEAIRSNIDFNFVYFSLRTDRLDHFRHESDQLFQVDKRSFIELELFVVLGGRGVLLQLGRLFSFMQQHHKVQLPFVPFKSL